MSSSFFTDEESTESTDQGESSSDFSESTATSEGAASSPAKGSDNSTENDRDFTTSDEEGSWKSSSKDSGPSELDDEGPTSYSDEYGLDDDEEGLGWQEQWWWRYTYRCRWPIPKTVFYPYWLRQLAEMIGFCETHWTSTCAIGCLIPVWSILFSVIFGLAGIIIAGFGWSDQDDCGDDSELALWLLIAGLIHLYSGMFPIARLMIYASSFLPDNFQPNEKDEEMQFLQQWGGDDDDDSLEKYPNRCRFPFIGEVRPSREEQSLSRAGFYLDFFQTVCSVWNIAWYLVGTVWWAKRDGDCPDELQYTVLAFLVVMWIRWAIIFLPCCFCWTIVDFTISWLCCESFLRRLPGLLRTVRHLIEWIVKLPFTMVKCCVNWIPKCCSVQCPVRCLMFCVNCCFGGGDGEGDTHEGDALENQFC